MAFKNIMSVFNAITNIPEILKIMRNRELTLDDFKFPMNVITSLGQPVPLSQGGIGTVYDLPTIGIILKVTNPCEGTAGYMMDLCNIAKEEKQIYKIPHEDKYVYILPNDLSEPLISGVLNTIKTNNMHFSESYGAFFWPDEKKYYMFMKKYSSDYTVNNVYDAYYLLFQIAHALSIAQANFKFTHYDLHCGNVLFEDNDNEILDYYLMKDNGMYENIKIRNLNKKIVKIIDFGFSRIEYDDMLINARYQLFRDRKAGFGSFNHIYDMAAFLGHVIYCGTGNSKFPLAENLFKVLGENNLADLLKFMYKINSVVLSDIYLSLRDRIDWRPKYYSELNTNARSMNEIAYYLYKKLETLGEAYTYKPSLKNLVKHYSEPVMDASFTKGPFSYFLADFPNETRQWIDYYGYPYYLWTQSPSSKSKLYPQNYFHIFIIDTKKAFKEGYRLKTVCCKLDPKVYMENKLGVAINGGFFDISKSFLPVGPYISNGKIIREGLPINETYLPDYRVISILNNNDVSINSLDSLQHIDINNVPKNQDLLVSGPLLVKNGKAVMTPDKLTETYAGISKYQCKNVTAAGVPNTEKLYPTKVLVSETIVDGKREKNTKLLPKEIYTPNCTKLVPGELSHSSNNNPRSMLVLRNNTDGLGDLAFVVVEGRDNRGDGVDLAFLSHIATQYPIDAHTAINLDGGRSSTLAWNFGDKVISENPNQLDDYTVGNILAFVK